LGSNSWGHVNNHYRIELRELFLTVRHYFNDPTVKPHRLSFNDFVHVELIADDWQVGEFNGTLQAELATLPDGNTDFAHASILNTPTGLPQSSADRISA
jgi:hypothetical protein